MAEEFQESDVVFSDVYFSHTHHTTQSTKTNKSKQKHNPNNNRNSSPVSIPDSKLRCIHLIDCDHDHDHDQYEIDGDDEVECIGGERLPPHLIVARRVSNLGRQMACSFYVEDGNGRILKGRNLCQVRNSILRLTGFIET